MYGTDPLTEGYCDGLILFHSYLKTPLNWLRWYHGTVTTVFPEELKNLLNIGIREC